MSVNVHTQYIPSRYFSWISVLIIHFVLAQLLWRLGGWISIFDDEQLTKESIHEIVNKKKAQITQYTQAPIIKKVKKTFKPLVVKTKYGKYSKATIKNITPEKLNSLKEQAETNCERSYKFECYFETLDSYVKHELKNLDSDSEYSLKKAFEEKENTESLIFGSIVLGLLFTYAVVVGNIDEGLLGGLSAMFLCFCAIFGYFDFFSQDAVIISGMIGLIPPLIFILGRTEEGKFSFGNFIMAILFIFIVGAILQGVKDNYFDD